MKSLMLTPGGAWALGMHVLSCGEIQDCAVMLSRLRSLTEPVPLEEVGRRADGYWFNPFRGLYEYMQTRLPESFEIQAVDVARYFGSFEHAEVKLRDQLSTLKQEMGREMGFFLHVGLPLDEDLVYRNGEYSLRFGNLVDGGGQGRPFTHLGLLFRLPMTQKEADEILADQARHPEFLAVLKKYNGQEVFLPANYVEATKELLKTAP